MEQEGNILVELSGFPSFQSATPDVFSVSVHAYEAIDRVTMKYQFDHRALRGLGKEWQGYLEKVSSRIDQFGSFDAIAFLLGGLLGDKQRLLYDFQKVPNPIEQSIYPADGNLVFLKVSTWRHRNPSFLVVHRGSPEDKTVRVFDPSAKENRTFKVVVKSSNGEVHLIDETKSLFTDPSAKLIVLQAMSLSKATDKSLTGLTIELMNDLKKYQAYMYEKGTLLDRRINPQTLAQKRVILGRYYQNYQDGLTAVHSGQPLANANPRLMSSLMMLARALIETDEVAERMKFWEWLRENDLMGPGKVTGIKLTQLQVLNLLTDAFVEKRDQYKDELKIISKSRGEPLTFGQIQTLQNALQLYIELSLELEVLFPVAENIHRHALQNLYILLASIFDANDIIIEQKDMPFWILAKGDWRKIKSMRSI